MTPSLPAGRTVPGSGTRFPLRRATALFRLPLSAANGAAALSGFLLHPGRAGAGCALSAFLGVTLLAAGASALNQAAEGDLDGMMERTRGRPVPSGELSPRGAAFLGAAAVAAGVAPLLACGRLLPAILGLSALAVYLAAYTPLKRRSPLAVAVGAIPGAVPPLVGWCVAGGAPTDPPPVLLAGLFYLWQVPHFWLLQRRHAEDYRRAGLPVAFASRGGALFRPFLLLWLAAVAVAAALLPALGAVPTRAALPVALIPVLPLAAALAGAERLLSPCLTLFPLLLTAALLLGA